MQEISLVTSTNGRRYVGENLTLECRILCSVNPAIPRLVGTTYFYWYDASSSTQSHLTPDNTQHADYLKGDQSGIPFSTRNKDWHKRELSRMGSAGLDYFLADYWSAPTERWAIDGLAPMNQAMQELRASGKPVPKAGMLYDTNPWHDVNLGTSAGATWFYQNIKDFYSHIEPSFRFQIDGKVVVWLYSSHDARYSNYNGAFKNVVFNRYAFDKADEWFVRDYGKHLTFVGDPGWHYTDRNGNRQNIPIGLYYAWGAAKQSDHTIIGPAYDVSEISPGFHLNGAGTASRDKVNANYRNAWEQAMRSANRVVMIETWNEWSEGTSVAPSQEYGEDLLQITKAYATRFHRLG